MRDRAPARGLALVTVEVPRYVLEATLAILEAPPEEREEFRRIGLVERCANALIDSAKPTTTRRSDNGAS